MNGGKMKINESVDIDRIVSACDEDDCAGFCIGCGADAYGVEPDARNYVCESCGQPAVYGAEELLFMCGEG